MRLMSLDGIYNYACITDDAGLPAGASTLPARHPDDFDSGILPLLTYSIRFALAPGKSIAYDPASRHLFDDKVMPVCFD